MYSTPVAGRSVDNLAPLSPGGRADYPFHSSRIAQGHPRPHSRRSSTASSIHSIGGALDTALSGGNGAVYESGQNAISTLLQPPIVRTGLQPHTSAPASSNHKPPTARDIPPVTLTNIPKIDPEEFGPYLSQISTLYEQLRRVKENEEEENAIRRGSKQDEQSESAGDGLLRPGARNSLPRKGSTASLSSLNSVDTVSSLRRPSVLSRKATQGPPPLSTIPTVYFDDDFHLENPRTFDVVSERSEVIQKHKDEGNGNAVAPRKTLATNAILQEKLSWYMDTIEIHLINSISTASTTFFTALGSLKELHSEAADSVVRIKALRKELEALDERVAANGLMMVQKQRRQENLRQLSDAVWQLRLITEGVASCESLVDAGEVEKALVSIGSLELLIAGERDESEQGEMPQLRNLRSASALRGVNSDLTQLRFRIGKAFESQFSSMLSSDVRKHVESVSSADVLIRWSNAAPKARGGSYPRSPSVFPTYLAGTDELKAQMLPVMTGLHRAQHIAIAATAYREDILREIRNLIRRPLPSSNDDDNMSMMSISTASGGRHLSSQEKSANLARNLRALDPEDAEALLTKIYIGVTETLRRASTQIKVLLDIASSLSDQPSGSDGLKSPPIRSPLPSPRYDRQDYMQQPSAFAIQEELHKAIDMGSLLAQAVDLANEKIVKILKVRSEQAVHLPLDLFLRYFNLNLYFTYECEAISGRSCTTLKTVVNNHIKDFVQKYRDAQMQKLAQGMESDQWSSKDFTDENTQLLNRILDCSTQDIEAWTESSKIWIPYETPKKLSLDAAAGTNGAGKEKVRNAIIESEKFVLPNSAILCLDGMGDFLQLIAGIPSMTTDIATSLVTYLQLFNSRCTQLILGAGATRSAGLKNITARHLALASQALAFMATLVPHVREYVRRQAGSGGNVTNLMGEFDKIRRLFQEHQDSIHQKLIEIMRGRAANHAKSIRSATWGADTSEGKHSFIQKLAEETTTLHRVLTKHLPETSIQAIMVPVFASYKTQLGDALRQATVGTQAGQSRMAEDVDFFINKLQKVDGFGDTGDFLMGIVKSKAVATTSSTTANGATGSNTEEKTEPEKKTSSEETAQD
ncbi:hypothetical protein TGAMA5MH_10487 [Trichoderma gamsii]|uniref:Vacuolar protein sorting-associated protein 54 C-terminal domain-containing protein n=1 Tax=Trichoderma gamsii TaxID=398673 RepID=A0A2K0SW95_9HYPO|nr:hypothetical protein TGAMA5MH_10487 [Trichoderma gamsii]